MSMVTEAWKSSYGMTSMGSLNSSMTSSFSMPPVLNYVVGEEVYCQTRSGQNVGLTYTVSPELPAGLQLDPKTGVISGKPTEPRNETSYKVTACRVMEVTFQITDPSYGNTSPSLTEEGGDMLRIDSAFASKLDSIYDLADLHRLLPESRRIRGNGDWMLWMVHRVWLNDPTLKELSFDNMHMPPEHMEMRIAPKLVKAIGLNSHLEGLSLSNSNLQKKQGAELAESLKQNKTVRSLNLDSNCLDSSAVCQLASAIDENKDSAVEQLRVMHQRKVPKYFGRPTEEAMGKMMQYNNRIVKLNFECADSHWRNMIDRALLRNNDALRRRQQQGSVLTSSKKQAEEKTLSQVVLSGSPPVQGSGGSTIEPARDELAAILYTYIVQNRKLPTAPQLQSFIKNDDRHGTLTQPPTYAATMPVIKDCRRCLLDAALQTEVTLVDPFGTKTVGTLTHWSEAGDNWQLDLAGEDGKRYRFGCRKEPSCAISPPWAEPFRPACASPVSDRAPNGRGLASPLREAKEN